jgi:hypothetical protein
VLPAAYQALGFAGLATTTPNQNGMLVVLDNGTIQARGNNPSGSYWQGVYLAKN